MRGAAGNSRSYRDPDSAGPHRVRLMAHASGFAAMLVPCRLGCGRQINEPEVRRFTFESSNVCYQHDAGCLQLRRLVMTKLVFIVLPSAADALSVQAADTKDHLREIGSAIQHLD